MSEIYDSAFRTELNDCPQFILPLLNEVFGENYSGNEKIKFHPNEHFIEKTDDEVITCRPADLLEPEFEKLKEKYKDIARSDEDVLSLALFEQVATDFLKKKYNPEGDVEVDEFNMYI